MRKSLRAKFETDCARSLKRIVRESGEKLARLLMGKDADKDVQFLGQF